MSLSDRKHASGRGGRGTLTGAPSLRECLFRGCLSVAALSMIAGWSGLAVAEEPTKTAVAEEPTRAAAAEAPGSAPIVLVIGSLPAGVDEVDLRALLSRELGAPVIEAAAPGQAVRGTLRLDATDDEATARFEGADGAVTERTVAIPSGNDRARRTLVVLSGNVARDESEALRAELLRRGARRKPRPQPEEPDPAPPSPPVPPPVPEPIPGQAHFVCSPAPGQASYFAGADFVPMLGTSLVNRDAVLGASLNVVGGLSGGVRGLQIGSVFNVVRGAVCGLQIGGAVNVTRDVAGLQIGGAVNITGDVAGLQIGGAVNVTGAVRGLQIGGAVNVTDDVRGLQIGGALNVTRDVTGLQIGGAANVTRDMTGLQLGGAFNLAREMTGLQLGGAASIASRMRGLQIGALDLSGDLAGAQIGAINVSERVRGAQIGAVNIGGRVSGVQIGAVNIADDASFALGAVSIVRRGRSHLDVWGAETGLLTAAFKHGGRYFHNYYGAGIRPLDGHPQMAFTLGLGGHIPLTSRLFLDVDALANSLHRIDDFAASPVFLAQARSVVGLRVAGGFAIVAGPSYNVSFAGTDEAATLSLLGSTRLASATSLTVRGWPGISLGLQAF